MSSTIYTIPPNLPLIREACGKALPCIATQSYTLTDNFGCPFFLLSHRSSQVAH